MYLILIIFIIIVVVGAVYKRKLKNDEIKEIIEAADRGDENAKTQLYSLFESGLTAERHNVLRKEIYFPKAQKGDVFAEYYMGLLAEDNESSLMWWTNAAEHGNVDAMRAVASGYSKLSNEMDSKWCWGYNPEKERYWLIKAANTGDGRAQRDMGFYYMHTADDVSNAIIWYEKAKVTCMDKGNLTLLFDVYKKLQFAYEMVENVIKEKEMLIDILTFNQKFSIHSIDVTLEDYVFDYGSAAFRLGCIYQYKEANIKNAAYCYSLSYYNGHGSYVELALEGLGYWVSEQERKIWLSHAKNLFFSIPS